MGKALHFFSRSEEEKIKEATGAAESKSLGEIAVMIVDSSTRYREGEVLGAVILGNILAFPVTAFFLEESLWWYIPLTLALSMLSWPLFLKMPSAALHFTGTKRRQMAVRDRAIRAFYEKGLHRTRGRTGVLFFISLLERKVWVLADKGIHEKISQPKLNAFAKTVSAGIRTGDAAGALIKAIEETGELLHQHFPILDGDTNELPDAVIIGDEGK